MALFAQILYGAAAVFCLLYYLPCALWWGWYPRELAVVLAAGLGSAGLLAVTAVRGMTGILWVCFVLFLLCLLLFLAVEGLVLRGMCPPKPEKEPGWILVPGYKPRKGRTPAVLQARIDRAGAWLRDNPGRRAILSGGYTGGGEPEAQRMLQLLIRAGADPARLVKEESSTTTQENMRFCRRLTGTDTIGLVTNGFHLYRAAAEARKAGFRRVVPIRADNGPGWLLPYHMAREFLTILSDKLNGYL